MEIFTLSKIKHFLKRSLKFIVIVVVCIVLAVAGWPWIKKQLLLMSYRWYANKPATVTYPNPLQGNPDFQFFMQSEEKWKFDSRVSFDTLPVNLFTAKNDTSYSVSLDKQIGLRKNLGFTDKARYFTQESLVLWSENNKTFSINLDKHSLGYSVSLNLHPELVAESTFPAESEAIDIARTFVTANLPEIKDFSRSEASIRYLSFDPRFGLGLAYDRVGAIGFMATFYPKIGNQTVYGNSSYAQIAFGVNNAVLFFDFTPLYFSPIISDKLVYLKNTTETKDLILKKGGYLDFSCNNIKDVSAVRLKDPELILLYNKKNEIVEPVYRFTATIKQAEADCTGKFFIPALKDKYYQ